MVEKWEGQEWDRVRWVVGGRPAWADSPLAVRAAPASFIFFHSSSWSMIGGWQGWGLGAYGILDISSAGEERRLHGSKVSATGAAAGGGTR
jgi:hypothetical protein